MWIILYVWFGNHNNFIAFINHLFVSLLLGLSFQVELEYANGSKFSLSAEFLRVYSPAVDGKIRSVGGEKVFGDFSSSFEFLIISVLILS